GHHCRAPAQVDPELAAEGAGRFLRAELLQQSPERRTEAQRAGREAAGLIYLGKIGEERGKRCFPDEIRRHDMIVGIGRECLRIEGLELQDGHDLLSTGRRRYSKAAAAWQKCLRRPPLLGETDFAAALI